MVTGRTGPATYQAMPQCSGYNSYRKMLLLGWVTAERSCPCKRPARQFVMVRKSHLNRSVPGYTREGLSVLTSTGNITHSLHPP
ncbi:hypothetical protein J6590_098800 [Homalodisca vitripennis]|nr:hypothetical protein J6590_098800 [Homalodisca vitripennis]